MGAHALLPLAVISKSERKVDSLSQLELELETFGTQAHLSDRWAKSLYRMYRRFPHEFAVKKLLTFLR
jgi:hypothetical protein